jgi:membrane associated rhomboid family serine protease
VSDPLGGLPDRAPRPARRPVQRPPSAPTTTLLLLLLFVAFGAEATMGGIEDSLALFRLGSLFGPAVRDGDFWRIGSYAFLHIGVVHFALNAWALWVLMRPVESTFGPVAAMGMFAATAMAGGLASLGWVAYRHQIYVQAAGASGGLFGLFGATGALFFRLRHRLAPEAVRGATRTLFFNLIINLALAVGAVAAGFPLDNAAHAGGFVSGIALGLLAPLPPLERRPWERPVLWGLALASFALAAMEGVAVARAVRPHGRVLRSSGVESVVPWFVVPVGNGQAVSPSDIGYDLVLLRRPGEMAKTGEGKLVRLGDRAWYEVRGTSPNGLDFVSLSAPLGDEHLLVQAACDGTKCTPAGRDDIAEQVAANVRITRPPTPP